MKSQIEHINIHSFYLISEMFTIYLPFHMARKLALNFRVRDVLGFRVRGMGIGEWKEEWGKEGKEEGGRE